jgi:uncharacterized protein (TIGR02284 family)
MHNTSLSNEAVDTLQELIRLNIDSRDALANVADHIEEVSIAEYFRHLVYERDQQCQELQCLVAANAEEPCDAGSAKAALRRRWGDLRAALGGGLAKLLSEAEHGEDLMRDSYGEALVDAADGGLKDVLQRHFAAIQASHERVRALRDALAD